MELLGLAMSFFFTTMCCFEAEFYLIYLFVYVCVYTHFDASLLVLLLRQTKNHTAIHTQL